VLSVQGGGDMPKEQYCINVLQTVISSMRAEATKVSSDARPTINVHLPGSSKPEGSWASCVPVGPPWADRSGVMPPWGPGSPPVIDVRQGPQSFYRDSNQCIVASRALASSVSSVISSVSSSRINNFEFGPRAKTATVTIMGGPCITHAVYRDGKIPNIYPASSNTPVKSNIPSVITASPKPAFNPGLKQPQTKETVFVTVTATKGLEQPYIYTQPVPVVGGNTGNKQHPELIMETIGESVPCREYPDLVTNEGSRTQTLNGNTRVRADCWSVSSLPGMYGMIENSNIWLHTMENCWLHARTVNKSIQEILEMPQCPTPIHLIAGLRAQYSRRDCYERTSLDSSSQNVPGGQYVDVSCHTSGIAVRNNATWIMSPHKCYFPGAIFDDHLWLGE
jgi:hypothetical protein